MVDDDLLLAQGTAKLIQRLGNHITAIADQPREIFQKCETGEVDLILMDVNLGAAQWQGQVVSEADLSCLLKNKPQTAHIPIILITAYVMVSERQTLLATSQADGFVAKPITDYQALLDLIQRYAPQP